MKAVGHVHIHLPQALGLQSRALSSARLQQPASPLLSGRWCWLCWAGEAPRLSSSCELTFSGCLASPGKEQILSRNRVPSYWEWFRAMMSELRGRFNFARLFGLSDSYILQCLMVIFGEPTILSSFSDETSYFSPSLNACLQIGKATQTSPAWLIERILHDSFFLF